MKKSVNRRDFLKGLGVTVGIIGFGGICKIVDKEKDFLRPPGALPEKDFLALCMRCQKCVNVCPTEVIQPLQLSKSIMAEGTPTLFFDKGYCDSCLKCTTVCPSGAILPITEEQVNIGLAQINKETCVAWQWMGCNKCNEICPYEAIYLDNSQRPIVDENRCNGCGLCEQICPSSSLRSYANQSERKGIEVIPIRRV